MGSSVIHLGLVGYPNAGKSTLISSMTAARPKTGSYPFTTLNPVIGVLEAEDGMRVQIADIPGLIEGAHANKGLGHKFLRHIERCKGLVILIDLSGQDGRPPWEDYQNLIKELNYYGQGLEDKPRLVVLNKIDESAAAENLEPFREETGVEPVTVSCLLGEGMPQLTKSLFSFARKVTES